jgi:hypothetical protein
VTEADSRMSLTDDVQEAVLFLADGQMPVTVTVATAVFPLVVGLGGFMTSTIPSVLTMAIALLPAVLIFMAVGALARQVLIDSAMGIEDAPELPQPKKLWEVARPTALSTGLIGLALFGPVIVMHLLGLAASTVLPVLAVACVLFPMAVMLRLVRGDWEALHPRILAPAVYRGGRDYLGRVVVVVGLFAPAALCWWASSDAAGYLQLALVGPLAVAPVLISARLLGRFLHTRRSVFHNLMDVPQITGNRTDLPAMKTVKLRKQKKRKSKKDPAATATDAANASAKRVSAVIRRKTPAPASRPANRTSRTEQAPPRQQAPTSPRVRPNGSHRPAPPAQSPAVAKAAAARVPDRPPEPQPKPKAQQQPKAQPAPKAQPQPKAQPARRRTRRARPTARRSQPTGSLQRPPAPQVAGQQPVTPTALTGPVQQPTMLTHDSANVVGEDMPDLLNMPGFRVVKEEDRDRLGASSK